MRRFITAILSLFGIGERVCGWCRTHMGYKRVAGGSATHGMCASCKARWDADMDRIEAAKRATRQANRQHRSRRNLRRTTGGWSGAVAVR